MKTLGCHGRPFTRLQWSQLLQAAAGGGGAAVGRLLFLENNFISFYCLSLDWSSFDLNLNSFKCLCGHAQSVCGHWEITPCKKHTIAILKNAVFVCVESETALTEWDSCPTTILCGVQLLLRWSDIACCFLQIAYSNKHGCWSLQATCPVAKDAFSSLSA